MGYDRKSHPPRGMGDTYGKVGRVHLQAGLHRIQEADHKALTMMRREEGAEVFNVAPQHKGFSGASGAHDTVGADT